MSNGQTSSGFKLEFGAAELEHTFTQKKNPSLGPDSQLKGRPDSEFGNNFVPHSMPQLITQPQVAANDDDIAALIAEISASAANDIPSVKMEHEPSKPEARSGQPSRGQQIDSRHQISDRNGNGNISGYHKGDSAIQSHIISKQAHMTTQPDPSSSSHNTSKESGITSSPREQLEANKSISSRDSTETGAAAAAHAIDPEDAELQEWLVYTNWFDLEYRARFLVRRRKIAALHNLQLQLIEEEAEVSRYTPAKPADSFPAPSVRALPGPRPSSLPGPAPNEAKAKQPPLETRSTIPAKREYNEESRPERAEKSVRDSLSHALATGQQIGGKHDYPSDASAYGQEKPRFPRPARHDAMRRVEIELRRRKNLDLGCRGESRFFIVKSFNEINVRTCMKDGLWMTHLQNGKVLTAAFAKCKNVILFFSINKSRGFQGYCRMATAPSPDTPRSTWMKGFHWETTRSFRVEWINTVMTGFSYVHHLRNSLNEDLSVIVGRDCQEIEEECARKLIAEMDKTLKLELDREKRESEAMEHRSTHN